MTEVCISVESITGQLDHGHYSDDQTLCVNNLSDLSDHLFGRFSENDPMSASYDNYCDMADATNASIHIRVDYCPFSDMPASDSDFFQIFGHKDVTTPNKEQE